MSDSMKSGHLKKGMALHMLAAHFGVSDSHLRELRAFAADEVKRTCLRSNKAWGRRS